MKAGSHHIVRSQVFDLSFDRESAAHELYHQVRALFYDSLQHIIAQGLDEAAPPGHTVQLHTVTLDLGDIPYDHLKPEMEKRLYEQLQEQLIRIKQREGTRFRPAPTPIDAITHFLQYGYLPWNVRTDRKTLLRACLDNHANDLAAAIKDKARTKKVRERLVESTDGKTLIRVIRALDPVNGKTIEAIHRELVSRYNHNPAVATSRQALSARLWEAAITYLVHNRGSYFSQKDFLRAMHDVQQPEKRPAGKRQTAPGPGHDVTERRISIKPIKAEHRESPADDPAIFIANAGLVLFHPYLSYAFGQCGYTQANRFSSPEAAEQAASWLHYACHGHEDYAEENTVLNKVLCGMTPDTLVRKRKLKSAERALADEMIGVVITQWHVMRNSSHEGFRGGWLLREGKLEEKETSWELTVERKAFDLLLDHLPYTLSPIKLPWMEKMIHVNWR